MPERITAGKSCSNSPPRSFARVCHHFGRGACFDHAKLLHPDGSYGGRQIGRFGTAQGQGLRCVDDPARQILNEQRSIGGRGLPDTDAELFNQLMLSRAIYLYESGVQSDEPIVFDRGIPDLIAYAELFDISTEVYKRAAAAYRYCETAFYFPGWQEIYSVDDERKMDFESAKRFGESVARNYEEFGYKTVEIPSLEIEGPVKVIVGLIRNRSKDHRLHN